MKTPKGQITRTGIVNFGDASLSVWEEGIKDARAAGGSAGADAWELAFKRQVFHRIVQTLNRLGWQCKQPARDLHAVKHYGGNVERWSAQRKRLCSKGALQGELSLCGRHIEFQMWQGINTPTRPDHGGRYESNKEACAPYLLRLEMDRTRNRIRDYLCAVFSGYTFNPKNTSIYRKPLQTTALQAIEEHYAKSWHFKGTNWDQYKAQPGMKYNLKSADGVMLEHGQRVWLLDSKGRWIKGTAYYNINNMWWVTLNRYQYTNRCVSDLHTQCPQDLRKKANTRTRRQRLESLLAQAIKAMNFERAALLRKVLFPTSEPLYVIQSVKDGAYFAPNYSGYRNNIIDAGKFTRNELKPYASDIQSGDLKAVPLAQFA